MKYRIGINQAQAMKFNMNINQAFIFDLLTTAPTWATPVVNENNITYYWVARQTIIQELPMLKLKPDTVQRHLKYLDKLGVIEYVFQAKQDLIKITEKGAKYLSKNTDFTMSEIDSKNDNSMSEINSKNAKIEDKSEKNRKCFRKNTEIVPTYHNTNYHNTINPSFYLKSTWIEIEENEKEKILAEIQKIKSPLLPIEQFVNSLIQHGYKYVDFVKAYQVWVSRAKSKIEEKKTPVENKQLTATEIIAMRKRELGL